MAGGTRQIISGSCLLSFYFQLPPGLEPGLDVWWLDEDIFVEVHIELVALFVHSAVIVLDLSRNLDSADLHIV